MIEHDDSDYGIDEQPPDNQGFGIGRRTALKTGAVGLADLTGFATTSAAHHQPGHRGGAGTAPGGSGANQFRFAGEEWHFMYASSEPGENTSDSVTLLQLNDVKKSNNWHDLLVFQPSIESSLVTDIGLTGDHDRSRAAAGVLGWIEVTQTGEEDWQMVTVDDDLVDPPELSEIDEEGNLVRSTERLLELARGVVAYNTRDFQAEWDLREITEAIDELDVDDILDTDWDNLFLDLYLKTRSANSFNYTKTVLAGTHDVRLRGAARFRRR